MYDNITHPGTAVGTMKDTFGADSWHFTSENNKVPDLHHLLAYKNMGGGMAYGAVACDSKYGFGVSAGVTGGMDSLSDLSTMYW